MTILRLTGDHALIETTRRGVCDGCADQKNCVPDGDMSGGGRLSLLAVLHSEHDPALPKLSVAPPLDFNDPMTATVWDNNVALWVADPGGGATWCPF